ncbi:hypothetical protein SK128_006931 [Halocaridina rubra]|uniref:Trophoblast glycoprotein n=1 Tax=Halocaridina rubra TaxID=373956 RepID=A0AAN8XSX2_HALRR
MRTLMTYLGAIVFLLLLEISSSAADQKATSTQCPKSFAGRCHCGLAYSIYDNYDRKKYTVNCTNTGFNNVSMLLDLPENTEVLIFVGNSVPSLPPNVLDNFKNYDNLEIIDMSNNHIRFIQGKSFHKVYNVKTLILDHNDIDISQENVRPRILSNFENLERLHMTNAFTEKINASEYLLSLEDIFFESDLIYLKVLHLEQNEIWSVGTNKRVFCDLVKLEQIMLGDNRLTDFDFTIDCLPELRFIDLERNMISRLSDDAMKTLDMFMVNRTKLQIKLDDNPFDCDCRSKNFLQWLNKTKVDIMHWKKFDCISGFPESNTGKTFSQVKDMRCPGISNSGNKNDKETVIKENTRSRNTNIPRTDIDVETYKGPHYFNGDRGSYGNHSSATVGILSFLLVFTTSLLMAVAYFQRKKIKDVLMPHWDYVTRKIGYTGIADEEAPKEAHV